MKGKLAYCSDINDGIWVFYYEGEDPCDKPVLLSGSTKTFDVLETVDTTWYTDADLPLEYLQIYGVENEQDGCGPNLLKNTDDTCLDIELQLDGQPYKFRKNQ